MCVALLSEKPDQVVRAFYFLNLIVVGWFYGKLVIGIRT